MHNNWNYIAVRENVYDVFQNAYNISFMSLTWMLYRNIKNCQQTSIIVSNYQKLYCIGLEIEYYIWIWNARALIHMKYHMRYINIIIYTQ